MINFKVKTQQIFPFFCFLLILIGVVFRFYNLSWGSPFFFHPDERNIASSISQLLYPNQMNPHFFAYGSLPIYVIYLIGVFQNIISNIIFNAHLKINIVSFSNAIIIGRLVSAILSLSILFLIYKIVKIITDKSSALITVAIASLSVGFIQYSHFATFEMWLSSFLLLLVYILLLYQKTKKIKLFFLSGIILGFLISIKVSSLIFLPACLIFFILVTFHSLKLNKKFFLKIEKNILAILLFLSITLITIFFTSPYFWIDNTSFLSSIRYETTVATGSLPVFYSQGFSKTIPLVYQAIKVYPFILNPILELSFLILLPFILYKSIKNKKYGVLMIIFFLFISLFSQAFLFVKWVRYYIPTLAFLYILIGFALQNLSNVRQKYFKKVSIVLISILFFSSMIFSYSFFKTVLSAKDTRVNASLWAKGNLPKDSRILSEVYDLGIVPFNPYFPSITLFNFYDLDTDITKQEELRNILKTTDFVIIPSQRIINDRIEKPLLFPRGNLFYRNLMNGSSDFKKIYETPCDVFCKILYLGNPIYAYEETANVFDRPTLTIFKNDN